MPIREHSAALNIGTREGFYLKSIEFLFRLAYYF